MKHKNQIQKMGSFMKNLFVSILLISSSVDLQAKDPYLSFLVSRDVSGSGLGGNVCPAFSLTNNKCTFSIGPNFQRKHMNLSGMQANFRYAVAANYSGKVELFFSGTLALHAAAHLSPGNIELEKSCHEDEVIDLEQPDFQVIECYGGIGLKINPVKKINVAFNTGFGMYNTLNKDYDREMYREKSTVALQLRFILIYNFKN